MGESIDPMAHERLELADERPEAANDKGDDATEH